MLRSLGGALMNGICALRKETPEHSFAFFCCMKTLQKDYHL